MWSEELRRADERSSRFRADISKLQSDNHGLLEQVRLLNERVASRDAEIARLQVLTPSAGQYDLMQANHDRTRYETELANLRKDNDFLQQQNQSLSGEIQEVRELLGLCESRDPTDIDRVHLKTLVRKLKQRNDQLQCENDEMAQMIQSFRDGNFNASEGAKLLVDERISRLQDQLVELETSNASLQSENVKLKSDAERTNQLTSAFQSNQGAIQERLSELTTQLRDKDSLVQDLTDKLTQQEQQNLAL